MISRITSLQNPNFFFMTYKNYEVNNFILIPNHFFTPQMLNEVDFRILNCITWAKTNPPPNLSCKFFTHSTEFILWARKNKKVSHYYNYELMKEINGGTQMRDLWSLPAIAKWEKSCGKHPTQKPLPLLARIILASTKENDWILDPFTGSSTTGIAASLLNRRFLRLDKEEEFLQISKNRREEIEDLKTRFEYRERIIKCKDKPLKSIFAVLIPILFIGRTGFPYLVVIGSVFSAVWDMQYVILQRYNRPKIVRLMKDLSL